MAIPGQPDYASSFGLIQPIDVFGNYEKGQSLAQASQMPQQAQSPAGPPAGPLGMASAPAVPAGPQNAAMNNQVQTAQLFQQREQQRALLEQQAAQREARKARIDAAVKANSVEGFRTLFTTDPDLAEVYKEPFAALNAEQQRSLLTSGAGAWAAVKNGEVPTAVLQLRETANAYKNSGDEQMASNINQMADQMEAHPETAAFALGGFLYANGGADVVKGMSELEQAPAALAAKEAAASKAATDAKIAAETGLDQALANIDLTREQIQGIKDDAKMAEKRLGFDYFKLAQETANARAALQASSLKLTPAQEKVVNESVASGVQANLSANAAEELANKFDEASKTFTLKGGVAKVDEWLKEALGNTDEMSAIRRQFAGIANSEVLKNLPPGAASDRDVALMREGLPEKTDDPKRISEFLRAQARVTRAVQKMKNAEAEYIHQNGNLGPANVDVVIDGKVYPKGVRFDQVLASQSVKDAPKKSETPAGKVRVQKPDGSIGFLPAGSVNRAAIEAAGGKVLE